MKELPAVATLFMALVLGLQLHAQKNVMLTHQQADDAIAKLRAAYAAFNRGDIDSAVRFLDPRIEWIEPAEFQGGGAYHGLEGAKQYLTQSRAGAAQVISEPERFITSEDRIVVFVHTRVLPKGSTTWSEARLADVYTFRDGRATKMRAFAKREDALRWANVTASSQP